MTLKTGKVEQSQKGRERERELEKLAARFGCNFALTPVVGASGNDGFSVEMNQLYNWRRIIIMRASEKFIVWRTRQREPSGYGIIFGRKLDFFRLEIMDAYSEEEEEKKTVAVLKEALPRAQCFCFPTEAQPHPLTN